MTHTYSILGMTCNGCAATVERELRAVEGVTEVKVNLQQSEAEISMGPHVPIDRLRQALKSYPTYQISEGNHFQHVEAPAFWSDRPVWKQASFNTLNCLIGCSIGDFGMVFYLQGFHPGVSMTVQMILATLAGLATSVLLETAVLHNREKFGWDLALRTALSMSFISMIAMELVMNATDFMITGGKAAFDNPMYWGALVIALVAGFLAPLPYNYYKLKKFNQACH